MGSTINAFNAASFTHRSCERAALILEHTHESVAALLKAFDLARSVRGGKKPSRGMTTDEEQDLLRAMLVMAAAGLDSMTKQLIRDALPLIVHSNERARDGLEKYLARQLTGDVELITAGRSPKFVAMLLSSSDLPQRAAAKYVEHLTAASLQSAEELLKIGAAFGLTGAELTTDFQTLRPIFGVRNKIVHELDIDLTGARRKRNLRGKADLVRYSNALLAAGGDLIGAVNRQLTALDVS
jgi:hypothetical protein